MTWSTATTGIIGMIGGQLRRRDNLSPERIATALYRGILEREPDMPGLAHKAGVLRSGEVLEQVVRGFIASPEFHIRFMQSVVPAAVLPDLTAMMPERYEVQQLSCGPMTVYVARDAADMTLMAGLIEKHRFYDCFGVWSPVIDLDKRITAAIIQGLGARSCFELGCFTGPVLSLLAEAGVSVAGSEVSHLAFAFAYPNIRDAISYGDLLAIQPDRTFDAVLCMDVLEHLNPMRLEDHIQKILSLLADDGYLYVNSPMWGEDRIFGTFEAPYLAEWLAVGDAAAWRHWPCDASGWPLHGHLVWASPMWWERTFEKHGLVRDITIEKAIHQRLQPFFNKSGGRRCLFVLRRTSNQKASAVVAADVSRALDSLPGVALA